ncbi:MAG TPA: hypothetical protein VE570_01205 [Thermoleophilaceae bacterium]|nr:hypothetical protein [Thermoleophilaceae bacterium]
MPRATVAIAGALIALATAAGVGLAQQGVPTVAVTASPTSVAVPTAGPIPAGPTRFEVTPQGGKPLSVYFILLNPGVSPQELQAAAAQDDRTGGDSALGLIWVQGSLSLNGSQPRAVTFNLRPGLTYVVISETQTQNGPPQRAFTTFSTSADSNGATAGTPGAVIRMAGLRFRGDAVLPRQGVVRIQNADGTPHIAVAIPLRNGVTRKQFGRAVRTENERAFRRVVSGAPYDLQNILGGGNTANDQEVRFPKAGRYGLVCFIYGHHRLGMYRIVTVK